MSRRRAGAAIVFALLVLALAACGDDDGADEQSEADVPALGFLSASASSDSIEALRDGLAELGYRDGATMRLDVRITDDEADLPAIAEEFVAADVDLIIAGGTKAIEAAKAATATIPIVMTNSGDPVRTGLVADMAEPGGNVTGLTQSSPDLAPKRLELLKEAFPGLTTVCVLFNPDHPTTKLAVEELQAAAPALGMKLLVTPVQAEAQISTVLGGLRAQGAAALVVLRDPFTIKTAKQIAVAAESVRLPAMYETANFIDDGGLMLYGPDLADLYRRAAGYVDKILRGADPAGLPIGQPTKFQLLVSTSAADRLGEHRRAGPASRRLCRLTPPGSSPRRRLTRRYVAVAIVLVAGSVLATGGINLRFSYLDARDALAELQGEQATAAAARIGGFVDEIDRRLATASGISAPAANRDEFRRLLFQLPAITRLRAIDPEGRERVVVSRIEPDVVDGTADRSGEAIFVAPRPDRPYYGPVEFRDGTEPYMVVSHRGDGGGAIVADVHLSLVGDIVGAIDVRRGEAFAVDRKGILVAHRDLTLVLGRRDLSSLSYVRAAGDSRAGDGLVGRDLNGSRVLVSYRLVDGPDWAVFVQQPLDVAFDRVEDAIVRTGALLLVGVALAGTAALVLGRRMVRPLVALQRGAARMESGDLDQQIEVNSGDELEALADGFNRMSAKLRTSLDDLRRVNEQLRESRDRIVTAADDARRRLERDLHDGAQQHLIAVAMKVDLARRAIDGSAPSAALLDEIQADVQRAITDLRGLAHGIFPPLLASGGLQVALQTAAKMAPLPTTVGFDGINRYPADIEATVYFCCVEALQNAAKHAGEGATVDIRVRDDGEQLTFAVTDDGAGFDPVAVRDAHGFLNMADRLGASDGSLSVDSSPGNGARISGSIPLRPSPR